LRMKRVNYPALADDKERVFQFLWGWN